MRVLMLTTSYPCEAGEPGDVGVRDLGAKLMDAGMDVEVAVPRPVGFRTRAVEPDGPRVLWLPSILPGRDRRARPGRDKAGLPRGAVATLSVPPFLASYATEAAVRAVFNDCIVAFDLLPAGAVGALLSRFTGKPLVTVAQSGPSRIASLPVVRRAVDAVVQRSSFVACSCDGVRERVLAVAAGGRKEHVLTLPLGIDLQPSATIPVEARGEARLLRADDVAGMDATRARKEMQAHDALVMPSDPRRRGGSDGLPRVLLESWACGLPVLAPNEGDVGEAIRSLGGGLTFTARDENDRKRVMDGFANDADLRARLRREALAAASHYSWHELAPRWADLIGRFERGP